MKKIILSIMVFCLMPFTFAFIDLPQTSFNISIADMDKKQLYFYDDFDDDGSGLINTSKWASTWGNTATDLFTVTGTGLNSYLDGTAPAGFTFGRKSNFASVPDMCIDIRIKKLSGSASGDALSLGRGDTNAGGDNGVRLIVVGDSSVTFIGEDEIGIFVGGEASTTGTGFTINDTYYTNLTLAINSDGTAQLWVNNDYVGNVNKSYSSLGTGNQIIGVRDDDNFAVDYFYVYNCTSGFPTIQPDTSPPVITIGYPADSQRVNNVPLNFNISVTDDTSTAVNCSLYNGTNLIDSVDSQAVSAVFQLTLTTIYDITYTETFNVSCVDESSNQADQEITLTIDTFTPILTVNSPSNNTITNSNIVIDMNCYDDYVWIINYTFKNASQTIKSIENNTNISTADNGNLKILDNLDISSLADGIYTLELSCSDSHTIQNIPDYQVNKDLSNKRLSYITDDGNQVDITLLNGNINNLNSLKLTDRYTFEFGLTSKSRKKYKFHLQTLNPLILINPNTAHFVSGSNWIDFINNDETAEYTLEKINDYEYYVEVQTDDLSFKSIGGLNIEEIFYSIEIDKTLPTLSGLSIDVVNATEGDPIQLAGTCSDTNGVSTIYVDTNSSGTFAQIETATLNGGTSDTYYYNGTAEVGYIAHRFRCDDSIGNQQTSSLLTYLGFELVIPTIEQPYSEVPFYTIARLLGTIALFMVLIGLGLGLLGGKKK